MPRADSGAGREYGQCVTEGAGSGVFVGRSAEVTLLRGLVAAVAGGRGGVAWVEGEPGIGKSALVSEALAGASELGCTVFGAAADQLRERFPLGVMLDCLGVDSRSGDGERGLIAGLLRGEGMGGVVPAGDAVTAAAERVLVLVDRLCAVSPVVLVVDDLQWADEASVSVWHRLAGGVGQVPLLVVGVSRPVPQSPGLVVARRGVLDRGGVVVSLRPLPGEEVTALVAELAGGRPGPGLLAQAGRAGGNPLYVRELTDALVREDQVRVSGGVAEVTGGSGGQGAGRPVSLAAAIEDRLGFLSAEAVDVLRVAALLGARFSVRDLTIVEGRSARELAGVMREAIAAGVLVESGQELLFRHGLIQQALAEGMPAGLRAELHRDAARALADAGAAEERVAAQLLSVEGAMDGWMLEWLAAHASALVHRAPRAAAGLLARAVAAVRTGDPRREVLTEHLAGVLFLRGRYEQVEPVARELLAGTADPERRARMSWTLAYTLLRTGRSSEALTVIGEALRDAAASDVWSARLGSARALVLFSASRRDDGNSAALAALADAERAGDRFAAGYALHVQSLVRFVDGGGTNALQLMERALTLIGDDPETTDLRLLLLSNRLTALANLDREADVEARQLLALAERVGTARISTVRITVAQYLFEAGRWDDALAEIETLFEFDADVIDVAHVSGRGLAALIAAHRGDRAGLAAHLRAAEELPDLVGQSFFALDLLRAKAVAAERDGRADEAVALLSEAAGVRDIEPLQEGGLLPDLVRSAMAAGDVSAAAAIATEVGENVSRRGSLPLLMAAAQRCRGLVDSDPVPLAEAVAYYRSVTRPWELGQTLEDLAVARAAAGDVAAARLALGEAVQIYTGLGADWDIQRADARLRPYGVRRRRAGARRPATGWAALTPTETKVAYLVGEGLSNPDIGRRLFLSRYTVQVHVSRILAKLQVRSRVEVAGEVARRPADKQQDAARSTA
jgi:DNA-binding CsgD family transcriptional regulator/tetratricopeptide (TPR) repeat protein